MIGYITKKLEQLFDSLLEPLWRRILRLSWPARLAVLCVGFAMVWGVTHLDQVRKGAASGERLVRIATSNSSRVPLRESTIEHVKDAVAGLSESLRGDFTRLGEGGREAWPVAQATIAVNGLYGLNPQELLQFFASTTKESCSCWQEIPASDYPRNVVASAWVAVAQVALDHCPTDGQRAFFLDTQQADGWWSVFPVDNRSDYASTYATCWALIALSTSTTLCSTSTDSIRVASALARGLGWLLATSDRSPARWKNYPRSSAGDISLSLSGLTVHVIHRLSPQATARLDRAWIASLELPGSRMGDVEGTLVWIDGIDGRHPDHFGQTVLPWMLIGTADSYPHASMLDKARALTWLESTLAQVRDLSAETLSDNWQRAELLIALRYVLDRSIAGDGRSSF